MDWKTPGGEKEIHLFRSYQNCPIENQTKIVLGRNSRGLSACMAPSRIVLPQPKDMSGSSP